MKKWTVLTMIVFAALAFHVAQASAEEAADAVTVQVTGRNVNLVKAICGDQAPEGDATFGALNALKVKEVLDAEGNAIEGFAGKLLHYLPVADASALIAGTDNLDKVVVVKGVLHKNSLVLNVKEFEVQVAAEGGDGDDLDDWDDWDELGVTTMSQQQVI